MNLQLAHSLLVVLALMLSFLFSKSALAGYDLHVSAFVFVVLYIAKKTLLASTHHRTADAIAFSFIVSTIVNTTGGLTSPYFFLLYFLLFALALFLEPAASMVITTTLILFFLTTMPQLQSLDQFLPLLSLALLTPFAMYLGQEYMKEQALRTSLNQTKQDTALFLSLVLKNHVHAIIESIDNFVGDQQLDSIRKNAKRMENLIEEYEKGE